MAATEIARPASDVDLTGEKVVLQFGRSVVGRGEGTPGDLIASREWEAARML